MGTIKEMLEEQLQQEILGKGSYFVFMIMCMIKKPALMTLCLRAMNFHALCDRIRGLLFFMLFEKHLMLWYEYDGGFCDV